MRANLVVITDQARDLYYSHWGAVTLDRDLFWGPAEATIFARRQWSEADGAALLDEVDAEGAAIIDHTTQTLLWFGGEDFRYDLPQRRVTFAMMGASWPGWTLRWALEGIADIADYLGVSREVVLTKRRGDSVLDDSPSFFEQTDGYPQFINTIVSSVRDGRCQFFATDDAVDDLLSLGKGFLERLQTSNGPSSYDWAAHTTGFPRGGVHLDWDAHELGFWCACDLPGVRTRSNARFPDLTIDWWKDDHEKHLRAASGLVLPTRDERKVMQEIFSRLLAEVHDCSDLMEDVPRHADRLWDGGPFSLRHDVLELSVDERRRRLSALFGKTFEDYLAGA